MAQIFLARHGETDWNAQGKLQGHTDVALNLSGRSQARELALRLERSGVRAVFASDLSRARETAELVASALGVASVHVDVDLRERRFGIFEGLTREECKSTHREAWQAWLERAAAPPGGEEREHVVERMGRALARAAFRALDRPVLVVSHGGVMRLWLNEVTQTTVPFIGNGAVYAVDQDEGRFRASLWNG